MEERERERDDFFTRDDWLLCYNYSLVERKGAGFIRCMLRFNGSRVSYQERGEDTRWIFSSGSRILLR